MILIRKQGISARSWLIIFFIFLTSYSLPTISIEQEHDNDKIKLKLQQCMLLVNQTAIEELQNRGINLNKEVETLCENNDRNKAQSKAIGFAIELQRSPDLANYRKCRELVPDETSEMQKVMKRFFISYLRFTHACDYIKP